MMDSKKINDNIVDPTDRGYIIALIASTFISFTFFKLTAFLGKWYFYRKTSFLMTNYFENKEKCIQSGKHQQHIEDNKKWRYVNDYVSLLCSTMCTLFVIIFFTIYFNNNVYFPNVYYKPMGYFFTGIVGYIIYDTTELVSNEISIRVFFLIIHHVLFGLGCMYPILTRKFGGLVIIGLIMECNSIFLHSRTLLKCNGIKTEEMKYKMLALLNILTFLLCRIGVNIYMCAYCVINFDNLDPEQRVILPTVIYGLMVINIVLFYKLLVADKFIKLGKKQLINDGFDASNSSSGTDVTTSETSKGVTTNTTTTNDSDYSISSDARTVILPLSEYTIPSTNSNYSSTTPSTDSTSKETTYPKKK